MSRRMAQPKRDPLHGTARPDRLKTLEIHKSLSTHLIGRAIYLFTQLESTNQTAMQMAEPSTSHPTEVPEGTLVLAEAQSQGRGRLGRRWISPPGVNIYASFILRPRISADQATVITCLAAISIVQSIRSIAGIEAFIKWPNDVLIHEKKVAGILTELALVHDQVAHLVLGIGINVNMDFSLFPEDLKTTATSILIETGRYLDRNRLLADLCNKLEERYSRFLSKGPASLIEEYRTAVETLGKRVKILLPGRTVEGWAEGIGEDGTLIVKTPAALEVIRSGDVLHLRGEKEN